MRLTFVVRHSRPSVEANTCATSEAMATFAVTASWATDAEPIEVSQLPELKIRRSFVMSMVMIASVPVQCPLLRVLACDSFAMIATPVDQSFRRFPSIGLRAIFVPLR